MARSGALTPSQPQIFTAIAHSIPRSSARRVFRPDFIGFLRGLTALWAAVLPGLQSVAASTFATNELSLGLPLH